MKEFIPLFLKALCVLCIILALVFSAWYALAGFRKARKTDKDKMRNPNIYWLLSLLAIFLAVVSWVGAEVASNRTMQSENETPAFANGGNIGVYKVDGRTIVVGSLDDLMDFINDANVGFVDSIYLVENREEFVEKLLSSPDVKLSKERCQAYLDEEFLHYAVIPEISIP